MNTMGVPALIEAFRRFAADRTTAAERLLSEAATIRHPLGVVVEVVAPADPLLMARWSLASRFAARGPSFHLKAIVENWDLDQIVREMNS